MMIQLNEPVWKLLIHFLIEPTMLPRAILWGNTNDWPIVAQKCKTAKFYLMEPNQLK